MPKKAPRRILSTIDDLTSAPPPNPLPPNLILARITQAQGKNLFTCTLPSGEAVLAELAPIFRGKAWLRRGGYVVIDTNAVERENKIVGQISNVVRNEKEWRRMEYWYVPPALPGIAGFCRVLPGF
jgi:probable RNA-binding protein EIF1AD